MQKTPVSLALETLETRLVPANTYTVTSLTGAPGVTLPAAVASANTDGTSSGDIINFAPGLTGTITLSSALTISNSYSIIGPGAANLAISGNNHVGIFVIKSGETASISSLTLEDGSVTNATYGGAISNGISGAASLTLSNCLLSDNASENGGGAIYNNSFAHLLLIDSTVANNVALSGGGVYNNGFLSVIGSTFYKNQANESGGGIYNAAAAAVSNSTLTGNSAQSSGGGINNSGGLSLSNSIVSGNTASNGPDLFAYINHINNVLVSSSSGFSTRTGTYVVANPGLATSLAYNGGSTPTVALTSPIPAVDVGDGAVTTVSTAGTTPISNNAANPTTLAFANSYTIGVTPGQYNILIDGVDLIATYNAATAGFKVYNPTSTPVSVSQGDSVYLLVTDQRGFTLPTSEALMDLGAYQAPTVTSNPTAVLGYVGKVPLPEKMPAAHNIG